MNYHTWGSMDLNTLKEEEEEEEEKEESLSSCNVTCPQQDGMANSSSHS